MKIKNNIEVEYVNIFDIGAVFETEFGEKFIILREDDPRKRVFTVLRIRVDKSTEVETCNSTWLTKQRYIGTAEVKLDIKIKNTTGER